MRDDGETRRHEGRETSRREYLELLEDGGDGGEFFLPEPVGFDPEAFEDFGVEGVFFQRDGLEDFADEGVGFDLLVEGVNDPVFLDAGGLVVVEFEAVVSRDGVEGDDFDDEIRGTVVAGGLEVGFGGGFRHEEKIGEVAGALGGEADKVFGAADAAEVAGFDEIAEESH